MACDLSRRTRSHNISLYDAFLFRPESYRSATLSASISMQIAEVLQCRRDSANRAAFFHRLFHSSVENLPLKVGNCTQFRSSDCSPKMNIHARLRIIDQCASCLKNGAYCFYDLFHRRLSLCRSRMPLKRNRGVVVNCAHGESQGNKSLYRPGLL
jgi:hypothetical protein